MHWWRLVALVGLLTLGASAGAEEKSIGTIRFGDESFAIVHAAAYENRMMGAIDLDFFNVALPPGETYFSIESDVRKSLRGLHLRIAEDPAYRNGTWVFPAIEGHDQFYYFDEEDPIVLKYETKKGRIRGSIAGEDRVGETPVAVKLTFDLPILPDPE